MNRKIKILSSHATVRFVGLWNVGKRGRFQEAQISIAPLKSCCDLHFQEICMQNCIIDTMIDISEIPEPMRLTSKGHMALIEMDLFMHPKYLTFL